MEAYIKQAGKRLCRASLQHDIAALRGFLRFLATDGRTPTGLDRRIDTPRLYRLEQLPRALPWDTVMLLLRSIDTESDMGLRDYTMFLLIATYGLRASEVVSLSLDDIRWRQGILRIHQRKTSSPLELPLTNEVMAVMVKHLKRTPPPAPYRRVFLRMRAPIGVLKPTAVTEAFQAAARKSGLSIPYQGPHCLRHAYALHLLKMGPLLRPSATSWGIVPPRVPPCTCDWRRGIYARCLSRFRASGNAERRRSDDTRPFGFYA